MPSHTRRERMKNISVVKRVQKATRIGLIKPERPSKKARKIRAKGLRRERRLFGGGARGIKSIGA